MVNWMSRKLGAFLWLSNGLLVLVLLNMVSSLYFFRLDLTEEKKYTIKSPTREMLSKLEDVVYVEVFLEGDLNPEFRRLRKAIQETLEEFRIYSGNKVQYKFTNPTIARGSKAQNEFVQSLLSKGIQMLPVIETRNGERVEKIVFPGAVVSYGGDERGVMLFKDNITQKSSGVLNQSMEGLEFELASVIANLTAIDRKHIAFLSGHKELDSMDIASFRNAATRQYEVSTVDTGSKKSLADYDLIIIAKPQQKFSEVDKYMIDQYLMGGGKLLLFLDQLDAVMDSASLPGYFAFPYETGLQDQLFRYGVRVNPDLVQDGVASKYMVVTSVINSKPQLMPMDWPFFPLVYQHADHAVTRNLDAVLTRFVSSIDTVKAPGIRKTPLLFTSPYSRRLGAPVKVGINDLRNLDPATFNEGPLPLAYLMEGSFTSLFKNRFPPDGVDPETFKAEGLPAAMVVVADGDFVRNDINPGTKRAQQLGFDPVSGRTFANQDMALNMVAYLLDDKGLITARNKEVMLRPLDKQKIKNERTYWQGVNLVLPVILIVLFGILRDFMRKRKYSRFG